MNITCLGDSNKNCQIWKYNYYVCDKNNRMTVILWKKSEYILWEFKSFKIVFEFNGKSSMEWFTYYWSISY